MGARVELRPLSVGEILDVAIKIYLKHAWTMWKIVAVVVAPVQFIGALIVTSAAPDAVVNQNGIVIVQTQEQLSRFNAARGVVAALSVILIVLATAACFKAVSDAYLGDEPTFGGSFRHALKRWRSIIWLPSVSVIILVLPLLVLAAITAVLEAGWLFALAMFGAVPVIIWMWISWTVATPVLLFEGPKGTKALRRSFFLVRGRWWRTLGAIAVGVIIAGVVQGALAAIFSAVAFTGSAGSYFAKTMSGAIAGTIGGILTTPFQAAVVTILFFDFKVRKEGFDLELLARGMGSATDIGPPPDVLPPPPPPRSTEQPPFWPPPPGWKPSGSTEE
ncbi:MAG: hypothetical protein QOH90_1282 [Actinomycetota bacterium]|nr:hypothetical protein [Actinomycetota bacterium]